MNYSVNIDSLYKNFPDGFRVPALLLEFGDRIRGRRAGSLGYFRLQSERFDDYWIENGADLHANFAFFMCDPTGGQVGYWLYDGPTMVSPPIVFLGSEGQLSVLSDTLEDFLIRLAKGDTQVYDLDSRDGGEAENAELARWLESVVVRTSVQTQGNSPDLSQWMDQWGQAQRKLIDKNSLCLQIANRLRSFVKPNAKLWETANFDVLLVGTQFKMWHRRFGSKPMPQSDVSDMELLFRSAREERAHKFSERGLWFSSSVKVASQGGAVLRCNFMDEPKILGERIDLPFSDYQQDFRIFPRSKHWTPEWIEGRS